LTLGRAGAGVVLGVALVLRGGTAHGDGIMLVEAGVFWMGSDGDDPNEAPQHRTYVRDFWIERDKVTNLEFARFFNAWGTKSPADSLRVTFRRHYGHRGLARGHHFIGFRCATSEDLGGR
jgi:sulfatase-modifying factor enzyme 1